MTATQKLQWSILLSYKDYKNQEVASLAKRIGDNLDPEHLDGSYPQMIEELWDELREGDNEAFRGLVEDRRTNWSEETGIPTITGFSKSVADRMPDGSWVGWTYWYGRAEDIGGKAMKWMEAAYDLELREYQKVVTIREFTKKGE